MVKRIRSLALVVLVTWVLLLPSPVLSQSPVAVQYTEGVERGFLVLRTLEGDILAQGDSTQFARGDRVTSHTILRFKDGSINEETVVFSQRRIFRLISDHQVQKGPAFKQPMDVTVDGLTDRLKLPPNVSNGMVITLLKNIRPGVPLTTLSMVAATPKPRLVKLLISPDGEESVSAGGSSHKAMRYVVKVDIGGVAGAVAPLVGKQPPDTHVWIIGGDAPAFVKSEGPMCEGCPIWRTELVSPVWE